LDNKPQYLYIYHFFISEPIIPTLQNIKVLTNLFLDNDPDAKVTQTKIKDGILTLVVSSPKPIDNDVILHFESSVNLNKNIIYIFSHKTNDIDTVGINYPPTYIFSSYIALDFGFLSYYLGPGNEFKRKLIAILESMDDAGVYATTFYPSEMSLVIESATPFDPDEIKTLFKFLKKDKVRILTSYQNF
jgi:hypothetical protein